MKLGQVLSFVDLGIVPPEHRERFQAKLATLRDAAPTVGFEQMRRVIERTSASRSPRCFADFDPEPIAAASIGQVYRAALHDGREVAVKVQYPGIGDAVRADMKNLGVLLRLARSITPELDIKAVGDEIRERIVEELDYELEASNQRAMARIYEGHPFIAIPAVVTSLCRERVIVTEFVAGARLRGAAQRARRRARPDRRDRLPLLLRLDVPAPALLRRSPPGNMIRLADGRIAFLDFGLFKTIDREVAELELACQRATIEGDAAELHRLMSEAGFLPRGDGSTPTSCSSSSATGSGGTRPTSRSGSIRRSSTGRSSRPPTSARPTSTPPATRTSFPSTSSAGGSSCSPWPCSASSRPRRTGTGSPASGSTATSRRPSWAARRRSPGRPPARYRSGGDGSRRDQLSAGRARARTPSRRGRRESVEILLGAELARRARSSARPRSRRGRPTRTAAGRC